VTPYILGDIDFSTESTEYGMDWKSQVPATYHNFTGVLGVMGARGSAVGWCITLQVGRSRVRFSIVSLEFFIDIILPGVDSASNKNEYQEYFLGVKAAGA